MEDKQFQGKIASAAKWSSVTQIIAKIIVPLTNMALARILAPEAFGVIATITMIVSFTEMFTDSGFQKYLIQHEFKNRIEMNKSSNVAFWTNLGLAFVLWGFIALFNEQIAIMVGNPGLGIVIIVACIQLPLTSFSSIQMALYRRDFDFKTLFIVRVIGVLIPFIVTIPLALIGLSYWSLIIGMISMEVFDAIFLTIKSKWKPGFYYDIKVLKRMLSFSIWSLVEAISIWLTIWIDAFVIGYFLDQYYLGIYKTSTIMVNSFLALVTASVIPILFSTLSRLQNDNVKFHNMFFKFQRIVSVLVLPLGVGIYLYRELATQLILGSQWSEASEVIGVWALTSVIVIVFSNFSSEVYRAKGKPELSFLSQVLHLIILVPTCIIAGKYGFWPLVFARAWIRMQSVLVDFIIMELIIKITVIKTIWNVLPSIIAVSFMGVFGYILQQISSNYLWSFLSIIICALLYICILALFPKIRTEFLNFARNIYPTRGTKKRSIQRY